MSRNFLLSDMKTCPKCEKTGSVGNDFGFRRPRGGSVQVQSWCRRCRSKAYAESKKARAKKRRKKRKPKRDSGYIEWLVVELGYTESTARGMEYAMRGCPLSQRKAKAWYEKRMVERKGVYRSRLERAFVCWKAYRAGDSGEILKDMVSRQSKRYPFVYPDGWREPDWRDVIRLLIKANSWDEQPSMNFPARVCKGMFTYGRRGPTHYHAPFGAHVVPLPAWWRDQNQ